MDPQRARPPRVRIFTLVLAVITLAALPARSQTFTEGTDVVVVEVPVQVIREGEPVRGLTAADFEVFDGRKKVEITSFEAMDLTAPAAPTTAGASVPVSARRHFLMLFDLTFSDPRSMSRARGAAKGVVDALHPTDLVAVATYNTLQGPQLVLGFTPDRGQVATAIETLGLPQFVDRVQDPLRLLLTDAIASQRQGASGPTGAAGGEGRAAVDEAIIDTLESLSIVSERAERSVQQQLVRNLTEQFTQLARVMSAVDGRKYVVFLSEGYDPSLVTGAGSGTAGSNDLSSLVDSATSDEGSSPALDPTAGTGSDARFGDTRTQNAVERMLEEFRRADCAIQSVNIAGLRAAGATEGLTTADGRDSLLNMAKSTGGEFYENFNDLSVAMGQMLRRTGVTYVLSFQPQDVKQDGEFHRLRVEVKNQPRGTRVVARPGWYAPQPFKDRPVMEKLLETANDVMGEEGGDVRSSVIAAPFAGSGGLAEVPVVVEVDGPTLLAGKQDPQVPVEIYIYVMDPSGRVVDFVTQTVGLDVAKAEATLRQGGVKFFGHFRLPPGQYSLRTLVRNGATGGSGLRVSAVDVPAFAAGDPTLIPGVLQDGAPGRWVNLRQAKREGRPDPPYLFLLKGQPYVPTSRPAAAGQGQELRVVLQGYNLGAGNWTAEAKLVDAAGKELPGGAFQVVDREAGSGASPTRLVASFKPPALQPGEYVLRVTLSDGAGKSETSTTPFAVAGPARPGRG